MLNFVKWLSDLKDKFLFEETFDKKLLCFKIKFLDISGNGISIGSV